MLRILLCDDDARTLDKIHSKVRETMDALGEKVSISKYTNADMIGTAALATADLALLDVDLEKKDYNGVDLARRLRAAQPDCVIVFITNYLDYAPEGYEVQAFRYVLKRKLDEFRYYPEGEWLTTRYDRRELSTLAARGDAALLRKKYFAAMSYEDD